MMAKLSIRCLLNVSLDNRVSFSSALSESRRLFLRSLSLRSLASAVSEPRQFFGTVCVSARARVKSGSFVLHGGMPGSELEYRDNPGKRGMVGRLI